MRRYQQRKILELLHTIGNAHDILRNTRTPEAAANLFANCANAARQIQQQIEDIEGKGTHTASLLETYVQIAANNQASNGGKYIKKLEAQHLKITKAARAELKPDKIEVAFFPYQLSMFDSLESVYIAASQDPQCEAYVVPIPYYELNPDGTLGKMHYDAENYPANIPVIDWREYDIEVRHPDIIFIHYGFDKIANNARVHPNFYSDNLWKHCETLIYIPYFVVVGEAVDDYNGYLPGVLHADRVILESEKIRQAYIGLYQKYDNRFEWKGRFGKAEEKFITLGSPKYDKIVNTAREDCELPAAWRRLISVPGGADKKIVLYNTHMFTWINSGEIYFQKLRSIFEAFRKRDDLVLWWRPHPNTELNFRVMRPELYDKYISVVNAYKSEGWGIYDDTPDLHRAIAWSDAYYGDWSSVVKLYKLTSKGIFITNHAEGRENYLCSWDFFFLVMFAYENDLYSFILDKNLILKINLADSRVEYFGTIPGENLLGLRLYHHAKTVGGKVILVPFHSGNIAVYDFRNQTYESYPLCLEPRYMRKGKGNFYNAVLHKNKIFLVPLAYRAIVAYNTETGETEHCLDLSALFNEEDNMFHQYEYLDESTILLPSLSSNKVLEFNLDTYEYKIHSIGKQHYKFTSICKYNGFFWLVLRNQLKILKWEYEGNIITDFTDFPEGCAARSTEQPLFNARGTFRYQNKLICLPAYCNMAIEFNLDTESARKLQAFDRCCDPEPVSGNVSWTDTALQNGGLIYFLYGGRKIFCYDAESETMSEICDVPPPLSDADIQKVNSDYLDAMAMGYSQISNADIDSVNLNGNAGQSIYDYAKKLIRE